MKNLSFLRTKEDDKNFHRSRIMFIFKNGKVTVAPKGVSYSHLEWFEKEGWVDRANSIAFLEENTRGFFFPSQNALYFYKGVGFYFDNQLIEQVKNMIGDLQRELGLSGDTRILAGPKKKVITGKEYPQKYLGTIRELTA